MKLAPPVTILAIVYGVILTIACALKSAEVIRRGIDLTHQIGRSKEEEIAALIEVRNALIDERIELLALAERALQNGDECMRLVHEMQWLSNRHAGHYKEVVESYRKALDTLSE